jgi:Mg2+ and Co2+ transporter CorA
MTSNDIAPDSVGPTDPPWHDPIRLPMEVKEIMKNPKSFRGGAKLTAVDIFSTTERTKCRVTSKSIDSNLTSVQEWLGAPVDTSDNLGYTMRLLICPENSKQSCVYPIMMEKEAMEYVVEKMNLPNSYISLIPEHNARYLRIFGPKSEGIILHMRNPDFSFITTYRHDEPVMYGLMLGIDPDDITQLVDKIDTSNLTCWPPVVISVYLLERKSKWIDVQFSQCYETLSNTEKNIGTFTDIIMKKDQLVPQKAAQLDRLDTDIADDLTKISLRIARADHHCRVSQHMIETVEESYQNYLKSLRELATKGLLVSRTSVADTAVLTKLSELKSTFQVLRFEGDFYLRRTEANRQNIYSLIAHRDNSLILRMQQTNLLDSRVMLQMAKTNTRDSAAMVVISVMTIIFLPGTFISSLLSTTIFNFQAPQGQPVTNIHWHGVYWAVTTPITLVMCAASFLFWRMRRSHDKRQIKIDESELDELHLRSKSISHAFFPGVGGGAIVPGMQRIQTEKGEKAV